MEPLGAQVPVSAFGEGWNKVSIDSPDGCTKGISLEMDHPFMQGGSLAMDRVEAQDLGERLIAAATQLGPEYE